MCLKCEHANCRGFTRAVFAEQPENFSAIDFETQIVDGNFIDRASFGISMSKDFAEFSKLDHFKKPLMICSSASFSVKPSVISLMS